MKRKALLLLMLLAMGAPSALWAAELTVHDGTATSGYVPVYGYYCDAYLKCEMVYPASELSNMANKYLYGMKFYASQTSVSWGNANFQVFLKEVSSASISSFSGPGTEVYNGSLSIDGNGMMVVTFTTNFYYSGGNLLVGIYNTTTGSYVTSTWYGETVNDASVQGYSYSSLSSVSPTQRNFLPKTTFTYSSTLTVNVNNNTGGTVTGSNSNCDPTNWYLITATPSSGYRFLYWKENGSVVNSDAITYVNMSTDHTYTAFFEPIYTVSASANPAAGGTVALGTITYNFDDHTTQGWTNIDADRDHVIWELYSNGITYENGGGGSGNGHNSSADCMASGSYSNTFFEVYTPNNFLVSPKVQLGGSISFYARNANGTYPEQIAVAVSTSGNTDPTDFTTIISSVVTLSGNAWTQYTVSLSDYSGAGYVAIRNYGTEDRLYLLLDDITIVPGSGTSVSGTYNSGQSCTATATANSGYNFEGWSNGTSSTTTTFNVSSNTTLTANFSAPIDVVVGTNEGTTNGSYLPVHFYYNNSLTQQIYKPSEIGHTGNIKKLSFYYETGTEETRTIAIYMKMTTANTLSAFDSSPGTLVYSGSYTFSGTGWQTITLNTPFNYNDICENLMITVDMNGSYSSSRYFATYDTGENRAIYYYNDNTNPDPSNPPTSSYYTVQSNNYIKLEMANAEEYKILQAKSNDLTMGSFSLNPSGTNCSNNNYFVYDAGTTVTLTASATTGNTFVNWTVDGATVTANPTTITMNDHHTVVANFSDNPASIPYTENFESNTWKFVNGSRTNKWYRGAAGAHTGSYGLFVSNDGTNNTYDGGSASAVWAYKTLSFDESTDYIISFDWKAVGESSYDYIRVGLVPASTTLVDGESFSAPTGWIDLNNNTYLNQQSSWQTKTTTINVTAGTYKLAFCWRNDTSVGNDPPAAIDNVVVKKSTHTLTASVNPSDGGTISDNGTTISGEVTYNHGTSVSLTANAATGYTFQNWTIDGNTVTGASTTVTMNQDHTVVANFTLNTYTVQVSASPSNGGTVSGGGTFNYNGSCTVTAEANECYTFDGWYEGDTQVSSNASYTFNVTAGHSLEAHFSLQQYTVTVSTGEGGGTVSGGGEYECGTTASILATPDECHTFSHFVDDNNAPIYGFNPLPIGVDHDLAITAVFTAKTYTISATAYDDTNNTTGGGTVSGDGTLDCGSTCTLVATPATNYVFDNWTENGTVVMDNGSPAGASYSFTVSGARTLVAHFHLDAVSISATAYDDSNNAAGGGTITGTGSYNIGSTCQLEAAPDTGYEFVNWTENGTEVSTSATYSFNVTAARDLVAHFQLVEYTLTLTANPTEGGTVSANPAQATYHYGDIVTVTATPAAGYTFGSWSDNGAQSHTVTITGDTELIAYFGADHTLTTYASPIEGGYVTIAENQVSTIGAVEVGDPSASGVQNVSSPYWTTSQYSFEECLYLASEIGVADAYITSISYYVRSSSSASSQTDDRIEVYMKNTDRTSFSSSNSDIEAVTANDKVFDGTWHLTNTTGWVTIVLDKPFHYTGSSLMIGINEMTQGASNINFKFTNTATLMGGGYSCRSRYSGDTPLDPTSLTSLPGQKINDRANVRLGFGTYHNGQSITLTAHANEGYQFVNWTENSTEVGTHGDATYTVTMDADHTIYANFERLAKRFITAGDWNVANNWSPAGAPDITEDVYIEAAATIPSGCVATANEINITTGSITIADGGQLQHNNSGVSLTAQKSITGYTEPHHETNWNYYLFSSPVTANATYSGIVTEPHYDLYSFDASADPLEWILSTPSDLAPYTGFIYASRTSTTISVTGTVPPSNTTPTHALDYTSGRFIGWNLIGNPFVCNAYVTNANNADMDYYVLYNNDESHYDEFVTASSSDPIAPLSALMVKASATGQSVTYSRTAPSKGAGILNIDVNRTMDRSTAMLDRARVRFGEGEGLEKFQFNPNHTKVYIPEGGKDFAVYYAQGAGTIPVNFKAEDNGRYTLDFSTEEVGFNYLHLIDNRNGNDVDLLQTPYYAFDAKSTDFASRFTLVFATGNDNDGNFAFFNNGVWIINNDGKAELQVVDALGRILSSETISGSCSKAINAAPGVYMLRLINGNDVKVQKVVVR